MPKKQGLHNDDGVMSDDRVMSDDDNNECDDDGQSFNKKKGDCDDVE